MVAGLIVLLVLFGSVGVMVWACLTVDKEYVVNQEDDDE